jgi:cyclopropane fatty-acyl-phospholipid synthase-like methyltransferase
MSIGTLARAVLGQKWFPLFGGWYRAVFVDLKKVVDCLPPLPAGSHVLDVGGGDGEMINMILPRYPGVEITMLDLSPRLGSLLSPESRKRVRLLASTSLRDYAQTEHRFPDLVLVSDVIHHVPVEDRCAFLSDLRLVLGGHATTLVVKDLEPGHFRSILSLLADRYISGDRKVSLVSRDSVTALVKATFPSAEVRSTKLFDIDRPNYALVFTIDGLNCR